MKQHAARAIVLAATCASSRTRASVSGPAGPRYPPSHPLGPRHHEPPPSEAASFSSRRGRSANNDPSGHERWEAWAGEIAAEAGAAKRAQRGRGRRGSGATGSSATALGRTRRRNQEDAGGGAEEAPPEGEAAALAAGEVPQTDEVGGGASQRLRADLLANYDRGAFPWERAWEANAAADAERGNGTDADGKNLRHGLEVELGINFHRVFSVDVERSTSALVVWFRQSWTDPRLAWNPANYSGITTAHFWVGDGSGPGGETSEIWTPDMELWNLEEGLANSLSDAPASVTNTGSVFWSRPGHLMPVCKFSGLDDFPFDQLRCTIEIGSWSHSGLYIRPVLMGDGYTIGGSETAGESFAEFKLGNVNAWEHVYPPYPSAPEEDWPVVMYEITYSRSWQPYVRGYLVLQIILNLAAFACLWMPPQCGERMGLAITALLAAVTSELVVSANLPTAAELTWFAKFSLTSLTFSAASLFESAAVIYFFYLTSDDLVPNWVKWLKTKWTDWRTGKKPAPTKQPNETEDDEDEDETKNAPLEKEEGSLKAISLKAIGETSLEDTWRSNESEHAHLEKKEASPSVFLDINSSDDNIECEKHAEESEAITQDASDSTNESGSSGGSRKEEAATTAGFTSGGAGGTGHSSISSQKSSISTEPRNGSHTGSKTSRRHVKMALSQEKVLKAWKEPVYATTSTRKTDSPPPRSKFGMGGASASRRGSLSEWGSGQRSFVRDADDFKDEDQAKNNRRWQKVAKGLDDASRVIFPLAYAISVGVLLSQNSLEH